MKNIHDPKYEKIKRLLLSPNEGDVQIGMELLKVAEFTVEELDYNFPDPATEGRDFRRESTWGSSSVVWTYIHGRQLVANKHWVYYGTKILYK